MHIIFIIRTIIESDPPHISRILFYVTLKIIFSQVVKSPRTLPAGDLQSIPRKPNASNDAHAKPIHATISKCYQPYDDDAATAAKSVTSVCPKQLTLRFLKSLTFLFLSVEII